MDRRDLLRSAAALAVAGVVGVSSAGCSAVERRPSGALRLGGGEPGGTLSKVARVLGRELRSDGAVGDFEIVPSSGSAGNLDLLLAGDVVVAPSLAVAAAQVAREPLTAVARLYEPALQCLVRAGSDIVDVRELQGRKVAVGPVGSDSAAAAQLVLESIGVTPAYRAPLRRETAGDRAIALAGGAVDAFFWWGGRPAPEITALASVESFRPLALGGLIESHPTLAAAGLRATRLPDDFYATDGTTTLGTPCLLLARRDTDPEIVSTIVRILVERGSEMVPQPANGLQYFTPGSLFDTAPFDLHPAAVATYRELHG